MNEQENLILTQTDENELLPDDNTVEKTVPEPTELPPEEEAEEVAEVHEEDTAPTEEETAPLPSIDELRDEIARLRAELTQTQELHARMASELGEFHALFPEVNTAAIPESIWEQVKNGIPLAASYALYEKKCALRREHAEKINLRNAKKTPGSAGKHAASEYFTSDEVRQMSQAEVRSNYQKILESMKTWYS